MAIDMKKQYPDYTVKELLEDSSFLRWRLFPTEEDELFWQDYIETHPDSEENITEAVRIMESLRINDYELPQKEKMDMLDIIKERGNKEQRTRKIKLYSICAAIASTIILVILVNLDKFQSSIFPIKQEMVSADTILNNKDIQLVLANQERITFQKNTNIQYNEDGEVIVSNGNQNILKRKIQSKTSALNKLIVPKGKQSSIVLADGTKIWINAGSVLEFPSLFSGNKREIQVTGEAYIEVTKNKQKPFIVNTPRLSVRVLGTSFNVSAYNDEQTHSVVLVEGKVEVDMNGRTAYLSPNQMLSMTNNIFKTERVDVCDYTSWKDGLYQFSSQQLSQIMICLSRYYDIDIECEHDIQNLKCTGKLVLFDDIEDVLQTISTTIPIKYNMKNNKVTITKADK